MQLSKSTKSFLNSIKKISEKINYLYLTLIGIGIIVITFLVSFFVPPLYAQKYAESHFNNVDKNKTYQQEITFYDDLLHPKFVVFTISEDYQAQAHFVWLNRKDVFSWDHMETSFQAIAPPTDLSDKEKEKLAKDNLEMLKDAVEDNTLEKGNNVDLAAMMDESVEANYDPIPDELESKQPGATQKEITDTSGKNKAYIVNGISLNENEVILNGEKVSNLKNVTEPHFDIEGKYLYYSKYLLDKDSDTTLNNLKSSGRIFRWDIENGKEEEFYDFGDVEYISFKANQEKLVYALIKDFSGGGVEIGIIDLETKEKDVVDGDFDEFDFDVATDTEFIAVRVLDIGQETALIQINSEADTGNYLRLNLNDFNISEL